MKHLLAISDKANYRLHVTNGSTKFTAQGLVQEQRGPVTIEFHRGGAPEWAKEIAFAKLGFNGYSDGYPKELGMGVFDSLEAKNRLGWNDEEYEAVLARLKEYDGTGDYVIVEEPRLPKPWPSYDELTVKGVRTAEKVAEKNLEVAEATGIRVEDLIAYEAQNRNDEKIIAAYHAAIAARPAVDPGVIVEA